MGKMTKDQLADFVKETAVPLIKDQVGSDIAKMVRENVEKLATTSNGPWADKVVTGAPEPEKLERGKGLAFARCVRAMAAAKMHKLGAQGVVDILRGWGDGDLASEIGKLQEKALAAGDATAGGFLVPTQFSNEVIELLRSQSVVRRLGARVVQMPTGTLKYPKIASGASAAYIGENVNIGATEETFGQLTLTFKKLAVLTPVSNYLLRYSSPSADAIVRDDLVSSMATKEDVSFIRGAGTDSTPKGLLNWCIADQKIAANGTVNLANITDDLGQLVVKLKQADIPMISPGWIMAPRTEQKLATIQNANGVFAFRDEVIRGTLWGWPIGTTTNVPITLDTTGAGNDNESEIYLVDFAQVLIGESAKPAG